MKLAAYIAALRLKKILAERKQEQQRVAVERVADFHYGDNGNEGACYLIVDNFR